MKTKRIWANLAVSDLGRATQFYTKLGFKSNGLPSVEITSFLVGEDQFAINFIVENKLRTEIKGELADLTKGNEVIFSLWAESKLEVDQWAKEVEEAGGNLISAPEEFGEGYYGSVFADPDGHRFNVFFMGDKFQS